MTISTVYQENVQKLSKENMKRKFYNMLIAILLEHFKMVEKFFICPHCWQNISMLIDI